MLHTYHNDVAADPPTNNVMPTVNGARGPFHAGFELRSTPGAGQPSVGRTVQLLITSAHAQSPRHDQAEATLLKARSRYDNVTTGLGHRELATSMRMIRGAAFARTVGAD